MLKRLRRCFIAAPALLTALILTFPPGGAAQTSPKPATEPLSTLHQFPTFATCAEFERATALPCPRWNPERAPKYWFQPKPVRYFNVGPVAYTLYERVFHGAWDAKGEAVFDSLGMPVEEAATVNIPPTGLGQTNVPGADREATPVPLKAPSSTQKVIQGTMGIPMVRNTDVPISEAAASHDEVLKLLRAIAAKLGVSP